MIKNINSKLCLSLLAILAFTVNFYFGSIGVFPIDTFAFFDSSYSMLNGNVPFRDYWTMNGPMIDVFQSLIFYIFGVSWQTYLLHSSLINVIFTLSTFVFLKDSGVGNKSNLFYSACTAILAYPSVGVPFPDHHSSIFSIIALYNLVYAIKYEKKINWILIPVCLFIAFFCKQTPAAYFIIFMSIFLFCYSIFYKNYNWITTVAVSVICLILILFIIIKLNNINISEIIIQYLLFPRTIGSERMTNLEVNYKNLLFDFKFLYISLLPVIYFFKKNFLISIIILSIVFISIFHQLLTKNQVYIFFLIPIICGYVHSLIIFQVRAKKNILLIFIILLTFFMTLKYHLRFNLDRKFMDLENVDKSNYQDGKNINNILAGLKWITPRFKKNPEYEVELINSTIKHLEKDNRKIIILTYYQFLSSVLKRSVYSPNRWYTTDGVSYPLPKNKFYSHYKTFYKNKIIEENIEVIYFTAPLTQLNFAFIFKERCLKIKKINEILFEADLKECL